ncbi:MAG: MerR family transcriptional regulator [Actinobacteria bacterium]|nr:MerR family transcriptional regulator [Actinomycetota bacterium]
MGQAAELLGVPASTLRYYEDVELIRPADRENNGYRSYDDATIARLRFISSAKTVGIPLEEVRTLADAYELDDCSSVAHQVVEAVASRLDATRTKISELTSLATQPGQLQPTQRDVDLRADPVTGTCGYSRPPLRRRPRRAWRI